MRVASPAVLLVLLPLGAWANQLGAVSYSGKTTDTCNRCHTGGTAPTVTLTGPATLTAGQSASYTLTITGGAGVRAGMNVAASVAEAQLLPGGADTTAFSGELHHSSPKAFASGKASFTFTLQAPPYAGAVRLFAAGNSCNGNGNDSGDRAGLTTLDVTVTGGTTAPRVATAPTATPETVTATTTKLSVLGADDGAESALTYTWSVASGPAAVSFSANGTNGAKDTTATFQQGGSYVLQVVVTDADGQAAVATVDVTVQPTFSGLRVTPAAGQVLVRGTRQFRAEPVDQFGVLVATTADVTWTATSGGAISPSGLFTAGASLGGPHIVQATAQDKAGSATVTIVSQVTGQDTTAPTVSVVSPRESATVGGVVTFEARATDDVGVARVQFLLDGVVLGEVTKAPWRLTVDTFSRPDGPTTLSVVAFDAAGNEGRSDGVALQLRGAGGTDVIGGCAAVEGGPLLLLALALLSAKARRSPCSR
jgi:hypothetical protein